MIPRNRRVLLIVLVVMLVTLTGCAIAYRRGGLPEEETWPPSRTGDFKSINLQIDEKWEVEGEGLPTVLSSHTRRLFEDSGLFWDIVEGPSSPASDRQVRVRTRCAYSSPWYVTPVHILSGWIIPMSRERWTVDIELEVRDQGGEFLGVVAISETETTMVSILFLPIGPFISGGSIIVLYSDAVRAAISEANAQGLF